jgi:hypothetical protein
MHFAQAEPFLRINTRAIVGMSSSGSTMDAQQRALLVDAIASDSAGAVEPYRRESGLEFELSSNIAVCPALTRRSLSRLRDFKL